MRTFSTLFSGFGGKCHGFKAAGLQPINHFEIDPRIAEVGQANSTGKYIVGDVCDVDWHKYEAPDVLGASPVCKEFSVANSGGEESAVDIATAEATCRAIKAWRPKIVFVENVYGYRNSVSFGLILAALEDEGYSYDYWHLNAADYGVPQTRKRLILCAVRERGHHGAKLRLNRPEATHAKNPRETLFGQLERWNGWYDAIEDLIPTLPESKFADWQIDLAPDHIWEDTVMLSGQGNSLGLEGQSSISYRLGPHPSLTIQCGSAGRIPLRAKTKAGPVFSIEPNALARLQTFPASYAFSDDRNVNSTGIGNAVPPLLAQRVIESIMEQIR